MLVPAIVAWSVDLEQAVLTSPLIGAEPVDIRVQGTVLETVTTSSYTYFRLDPDAPEQWHVVMSRPVQVGDSVVARGYSRLTNFESSSLERTFPVLIFSSVEREEVATHHLPNSNPSTQQGESL